MGLYAADSASTHRSADEKKNTVFLRAVSIPHARREVQEIGIGSGLNLPFYSAQSSIYGVEAFERASTNGGQSEPRVLAFPSKS